MATHFDVKKLIGTTLTDIALGISFIARMIVFYAENKGASRERGYRRRETSKNPPLRRHPQLNDTLAVNEMNHYAQSLCRTLNDPMQFKDMKFRWLEWLCE